MWVDELMNIGLYEKPSYEHKAKTPSVFEEERRRPVGGKQLIDQKESDEPFIERFIPSLKKNRTTYKIRPKRKDQIRAMIDKAELSSEDELPPIKVNKVTKSSSKLKL